MLSEDPRREWGRKKVKFDIFCKGTQRAWWVKNYCKWKDHFIKCFQLYGITYILPNFHFPLWLKNQIKNIWHKLLYFHYNGICKNFGHDSWHCLKKLNAYITNILSLNSTILNSSPKLNSQIEHISPLLMKSSLWVISIFTSTNGILILKIQPMDLPSISL